jgi:hypothetical protein
MSGQWPPEWEDSAEEFPGEADQLDTEAEARLSEVAAFLASVSAPAMPDAVEARISAALTAEAAASDGHAAPADGSRTLGPAPARARVRRRRGGDGPRRRFRVRPQVVGGSLVTCLLLAVLGFALSHASSSSSSSGAFAGSAARPAEVSGAAASSAAGAGAAGPASLPSAAPSAAPSAVPSAVPSAAPSATVPGPKDTRPGASFTVTVSGTKYQQATLAEQVRAKLPTYGPHPTSGTTVPAASASAASATVAPDSALRGCVLSLTGGTSPRLVDRATYQGDPAYVIASSSRVWVVGLGCTAAKPELIESVPLAGLPGNLRALISVEGRALTGRRVQ